MAYNLLKLLLKVKPKEIRNFHTSSCCNANPGKTMKKVMGGGSFKKRRVFSESATLPTPAAFTKGAHEGRYSGNSRRSTVLNKMFMRHITDLMATGESSSEFLGHGIEINRVKITPDFKGLNVFWVAKGTEDDEVVENVLQKSSGFLRHELSTLRVMGEVPKIYFVKDKQYAQIIELDARLEKADYGEGYVPVEMGTKFKTQLELYAPLEPNLKEKIERLDAEVDVEDLDDEEPLPPMPQDVLRLNHADILNRVKKLMKKAEATHRMSSSYECEQVVNENPIDLGSNREKREVFEEFLTQRKRLRNKAVKAEKNYDPDLEYLKQEINERSNAYFDNMDIYDDDHDYLYEDEEKSK